MRLMPSATQPCGIKELVALLRPGSLAAHGAHPMALSTLTLTNLCERRFRAETGIASRLSSNEG